MILYNTTLVVTGGKLIKKVAKNGIDTQIIEEKVKCKWQTHGCGNFVQNVKYILQNQFGHKLPDLPGDLLHIKFKFEEFDV